VNEQRWVRFTGAVSHDSIPSHCRSTHPATITSKSINYPNLSHLVAQGKL
jgi:hypothetical protein